MNLSVGPYQDISRLTFIFHISITTHSIQKKVCHMHFAGDCMASQLAAEGSSIAR